MMLMTIHNIFVDTYLLGTVMLVFGMGLYELFISNLTTSETISHDSVSNRSSLFGMFPLKVAFFFLRIFIMDQESRFFGSC